MSLVECLVGLAVASVVGAIAATGLSMTGLAVMRQRAATVDDDAVWLAQAAIANDLRASATWKGCIEARGCTLQTAHTGSRALVLAQAEWVVDGGLWRCEHKRKQCDKYLEGVTGIALEADIADGKEHIRRVPFAQDHGNDIRAVEVMLSTRDGRFYKRTTGVHERAAAIGGSAKPDTPFSGVDGEGDTHAP